MTERKITVPISFDDLKKLRSGDQLMLSGSIYVARDEAHSRLVALKRNGEKLPVDLQGQIIYYAGPAPARPGEVVNSIGPTTARRMDAYTEDILKMGVLGMIGKGERGDETKKLMKGRAIYMAALGGIGALLSQTVLKQETVAFEDAGMGAMLRLEVKDFPVVVINDLDGHDFYTTQRSDT